MKKKNTTAILALLFGVYGLHRFYLGQRFRGIAHLMLGFGGLLATVTGGPPFVIIPALLGFIDAILFFVMPQEEFDNKHNYNKKTAWFRRVDRKGDFEKDRDYIERPETHYKLKGIESYKDFDFETAISYFEKSLNIKYDNNAIHFNLACCFSHLEMEEESFFHLEKAFEFGFKDIDILHKHAGLSYIRTLPTFDHFVENDYQLDRVLPTPSQASPGEPPHVNSRDLLEKIAMLGEFREKGILTEQEFQEQKQLVLRGNG